MNEDKESMNIVNKYKDAGKIVNAAILFVQSKLLPGVNIAEICAMGDKFIMDATNKVYQKCKRGIAFPTCISPNNIIANFAPSIGSEYKLRDGDVVKIELGVHIDGYPVLACQTFILNTIQDTISDKRANVLLANRLAVHCLLRTIKKGMDTCEVEKIISDVAADFKCCALVDGQVNELGRFQLYNESKSSILEANKAYSFNILMSSNESTNKLPDCYKSTIYVKSPTTYSLKLKASRQVFAEVAKFSTGFPFHSQNIGKELSSATLKLGMSDCFKHGLVEDFPILSNTDEEDNNEDDSQEYVSKIRFTVLIRDDSSICLNEAIMLDSSESTALLTTTNSINNEDIRNILKKKKLL